MSRTRKPYKRGMAEIADLCARVMWNITPSRPRTMDDKIFLLIAEIADECLGKPTEADMNNILGPNYRTDSISNKFHRYKVRYFKGQAEADKEVE